MKKYIVTTCITATLLTTSMLGDSVIWPAQAVHAEQSSVSTSASKLETKEQAIARAKAFKLIPERAIVKVSETTSSAKEKQWLVVYQEPEKNKYGQPMLSGGVTLDAATGAVVGFTESKRAPEKELTAVATSSNEGSAVVGKVSRQGAIEKAEAFIDSLPWILNVDWLRNPYPESTYQTRFDDPSQHKIIFQNSHEGIRIVNGAEFILYFDMGTGNLTAYDARWTAFDFEKVNHAVTLEKAQAEIFDRLKPELAFYSMDEVRPLQLLYSLGAIKVDAATGAILGEDKRLVYHPDNWKPINTSKSVKSGSSATGTNKLIDEQTARASAAAYLKQKFPERISMLSEDFVTLWDDRYTFRFIMAVSGIPNLNDYIEIDVDSKSGKILLTKSQLTNYKYPKEVVPKVVPERAKRILLSMYDVEPQYQVGQDGKTHLYYQLVAKPETPIFYTGQAPYLDANDGVFRNFLGDPIIDPIPSASPWLKQLIGSPERINYKIAVVLDGKLMKLQDDAVIRNQFTLMPFRELLQGIGATFTWDEVNRKVTAKTKDTVLELTIDSKTAYVNGKSVVLEAPAQLVNQRTYMPARFVADALGANVKWDAESKLALLQTDAEAKPLSKDELQQLRYEAEQLWESKHWQ